MKFIIDLGNTLSHSSCLGGSAECFHCCVQHDIPVDYINMFDETPLEVARKIGKSLSIEKAANNKIRCKYCVRNALKDKHQKEHDDIEERNKTFSATAAAASSSSSSATNKSAQYTDKDTILSAKSTRAASSLTQPDRDFLAQYLLDI